MHVWVSWLIQICVWVITADQMACEAAPRWLLACSWFFSLRSGSSSPPPWKDEHPVACLWVICDSQSSCLGPAYSQACPPGSLATPGTPQTDSSSFAPMLWVSAHSKVWEEGLLGWLSLSHFCVCFPVCFHALRDDLNTCNEPSSVRVLNPI